MRSFLSFTKKLSSLFLLVFTFSGTTYAQSPQPPAILVIGASYSNGNLPLDNQLNGVWGGINVGLGSYLDLGQALIKDPRLPGYVINEAEAGGSTLSHRDCSLFGGTVCSTVHWKSYDEQFERALRRVAIPGVSGAYNAKYVVITLSNDCLHSNSFDIPEAQAMPCSVTQLNQYIDRLIALGQKALNFSITPIFDIYPSYNDLNLPVAGAAFAWIMDETSYNLARDLHRTRLSTELPGAVVLNMWQKFEHNGDGIHPNAKTAREAAAIVSQYIINH